MMSKPRQTRLALVFASLSLLLLGVLDYAGRRVTLDGQILSARGASNYIASMFVLAIVIGLSLRLPRRARGVFLVAFVAFPIFVQYTLFRTYAQWLSSADMVTFFEAPFTIGRSAIAGSDLYLAMMTFASVCAALLPVACSPPIAASKLVKRLSVASLPLGLALTIASGAYWYAAPTLEQPLLPFYGVSVALAKRAFFRMRSGEKPRIPKQPPRVGEQPNLVLIVGESLGKKRLHLFGYSRPTTPELDQMAAAGELVPMQDALVLGPTTRVSVPYILTGLEGPDPYGRVYRTPTIIEYAKACGYHTALLSAQDLRWGNMDTLFRDDADTMRTGVDVNARVDVLKGIDDGRFLDQEVLPVLARLESPFLIVWQLDGSHMPYAAHSPSEQKRFLPETDENDDNAYDNTVLVTDHTLATFVKELRRKDPNAWAFFTSDHGQALGEGGAFFNRGYQPTIVENPLIVFPPPAARAKMQSLARTQVSSSDLVPTMLGLMHIAPVFPLDGQDWLSTMARPTRDRVVTAYTPTYANEPTVLWIGADGARHLYDMEHGNVTEGDGRVLSSTLVPLPDVVERRLHP